MKELILFSFVVLFISCQNPSISHFQTAPDAGSEIVQTLAPVTEALICASHEVETMDWTETFADSKNPGIHSRAVVMRSEIPASVPNSELVCISQVSSSTEDQEPSPALTLPMAFDSDSDLNESWKAISEQWDIQKKLSCGTQNLQNLNPVCQNKKMIAAR